MCCLTASICLSCLTQICWVHPAKQLLPNVRGSRPGISSRSQHGLQQPLTLVCCRTPDNAEMRLQSLSHLNMLFPSSRKDALSREFPDIRLP